jgi:hypothetical protein
LAKSSRDHGHFGCKQKYLQKKAYWIIISVYFWGEISPKKYSFVLVATATNLLECTKVVSGHILRKEILKSPYLDNTFLEVAKT